MNPHSTPMFEVSSREVDPRKAALETVARAVESYVRSRFAVPPSDTVFTRTVDLFEEGYVDSTGLVELIAYLEELYDVRLPEEALFDPSFSHIDGIARVVAELITAEGRASSGH